MSKMIKAITVFGASLGLCASFLPFTTNAETNITLQTNTLSVTIADYYELSVVTGTGGSGVTYTNGTYSGTMVNGVANSSFGTTVLGAICNSTNGWKLQAVSSTKNSSNQATMVGASTNLTINSASTTLDGSASTWTMVVSSADENVTVASGFSSAHVVPSSTTTIATGAYGDRRNVSVTYGIGIASTQAADTYTGSITYTLSPNT